MSAEQFNLVADIGGTNARFALHHQQRSEFVHPRTYFCAEYARLEDALAEYLRDSGARVKQAAIAIATPVSGDFVQMTNHHWRFSIQQAQRELRLQRLTVLNDFTALALSLPHLSAGELVQVGGASAEPQAAIGVIGPGTGLGVSGLLWSGERWLPLSSEGGHVMYAPQREREWQMAQLLARRYGNFPSFERIVSGPGLCAVYESLCELDGVAPLAHTPAEVAQRASENVDARFHEVFEIFCAALGNAAGNLALTLGARGGIYIGGGIVPRWGEQFLRSGFRQSFENKGRLSAYLASIPCFVVHAKLPALIGAATVFDPLAAPAVEALDGSC